VASGRWFANRGQIVQIVLQLTVLAIASKGGWRDVMSSRYLSAGAILFYCLIGLVVFTFVWWGRTASRLPLSAMSVQSYSDSLELQSGLIFQIEHIEPHSTDPKITYHAKLRIVLTNMSGEVLRLLQPSWTMGPDDVPAAFPLGFKYQLEASLGAWRRDKWHGVWNYALWNKQELTSIHVDPGWNVTLYIGLSESVPYKELVTRSTTLRLGILTIPIKVGTEKRKWERRF
jgi:hypothetical protein